METINHTYHLPQANKLWSSLAAPLVLNVCSMSFPFNNSMKCDNCQQLASIIVTSCRTPPEAPAAGVMTVSVSPDHSLQTMSQTPPSALPPPASSPGRGHRPPPVPPDGPPCFHSTAFLLSLAMMIPPNFREPRCPGCFEVLEYPCGLF